jgi:hypothetical protein
MTRKPDKSRGARRAADIATTKTKLTHLLPLIGLLIVFVFAGYFLLKNLRNNHQNEPVPTSVDFNQIIAGTKDPAASTNPTSPVKPPDPPTELNLKVPFYPQAPFGNWSLPWQDACEEASVLLIANVYYQHNWTRVEFNTQLLQLVDWEKKQFGYYEDTGVDQIAEMLNKDLGLKTIIHENPTFDDVKNVLAQGHLIVMTFAGRELGNPNYTGGGPLYHALVVKGYTANQKIITNDVGTHNGADYVYDWKTIQHALHDFHKPIDGGAKRFIEVLPPENKN